MKIISFKQAAKRKVHRVRINRWLLAVIIGIFFGAFVVNASENKGAEQMVLYGGKSGKVPFPHAVHQSALNDCKACHGIFPQESGAIETFKKQGKLKKKEVMKQCTVCHRKTAKAGQKSGPTRCKTCHNK